MKSLFLLLVIAVVAGIGLVGASGGEEAVHLKHVSPSDLGENLCVIRQLCSRCGSGGREEGEEEQAECRRTGYVQTVECFAHSPFNSTSSTIRVEACEDSSLQLLGFFQFNLVCVVVAAMALMGVRARKNHARQSLVQLVNRS
ncbi:hypothetical protein BASA81_015046 [Batrachochytrium salamandrivorans]|nr:hypothetical protein BASA81_015046 [Batrachochytrium salamandrivorans]